MATARSLIDAAYVRQGVQMLNNWFLTPFDPGSTGSAKTGRPTALTVVVGTECCRRGAAPGPAASLVVPAKYWQPALSTTTDRRTTKTEEGRWSRSTGR